LRWSSPTLDSFLYDLSRAGKLTGMSKLEQGKGLEFSPYATGRTRQFFPGGDRSWQGSVGGELTWKITPQLVTVFTVNTDFAETEVDTRQVNLTRFPLFFPEKRAFFLEGANQYDFGLGLGGDSAQFIPFFSRRIDCWAAKQIPHGRRQGEWPNRQMERARCSMYRLGKRLTGDYRGTRLPSTVVPGTNCSGRVYDFNENLRIGTIVTNGDPEGLRQNTLAGIDAVWRTSKFRGNKNLLVGAWTATTQGDVGPAAKSGWGFKKSTIRTTCGIAARASINTGSSRTAARLPAPSGRSPYSSWLQLPAAALEDGPFRWIRQEFSKTSTCATPIRKALLNHGILHGADQLSGSESG
jgi:hypothetical protein